MHILLTNDDGIHSPGLHLLASTMKRLGTVYVVAPEREQGAVGHAVTLHKPLRLHRVRRQWFSVSGTPSDCVTLAVHRVLPSPPALLVSGINRGVNLGDDVTYSGTVSGAFEGALHGIPSMAVSQEGSTSFRFGVAALYALRLARSVLQDGLPAETLLNVNVPDRPRHLIRGVKITSLSRRRYVDPVVERQDPRGRRYYWIAGTRVSSRRGKDPDYVAMRDGMVSVTPLRLDLTSYRSIPALRAWEPILMGRAASSRAR